MKMMSIFDQNKQFFGDSNIIPVINMHSGSRDAVGNYIVEPLPEEFLTLKPEIIKGSEPIDYRFVNFYNPNTKKLSLPFVKEMIDYIRLSGQYATTASLASIALDPNPWVNTDFFEDPRAAVFVVE